MRLYHFCSNKDAKGIFKEGITIGGVVTFPNGQMRFTRGYQWLTLDANPTRQSWATQHLLPYSRLVWRFTIDIPEEYEYRVLDRDKLEEIVAGAKQSFDGWDGSENWRVYKGVIPTTWIMAVERMENDK